MTDTTKQIDRQALLVLAADAGFSVVGCSFVMPTHSGHITEEIEKFAELLAARATPSPVPADTAELPPLPEPFEINWPELNSSALGCGVEDRGIRDRYDAAAYGWEDGVGRAIERVPEEIYTADQMRDYARATLASRPAPVAAMTVEQARRTGYGEGVRRAAQLVEQAIDNEGRMALAARIRDLQSAAPAAPSAAQAAGVPDGWRIRKNDDGTISIQKEGIGGYLAESESDTIASSILWELANDLLATTPSEGVAFIPLCARCAETGECRPLGARGCEGVAAPVEASEKFSDIRALLGEAYCFQSTSPAAQANINSALDLLDEIEAAQPSADQVASEAAVRDAALAECEAICNNVHDQYHAQRLIRELRTSGEKGGA